MQEEEAGYGRGCSEERMKGQDIGLGWGDLSTNQFCIGGNARDEILDYIFICIHFWTNRIKVFQLMG